MKALRALFLASDELPGVDERMLYRPALLGTAQLHYVRSTYDVDEWKTISVMTALEKSASRNLWNKAEILEDAPDRAAWRDLLSGKAARIRERQEP